MDEPKRPSRPVPAPALIRALGRGLAQCLLVMAFVVPVVPVVAAGSTAVVAAGATVAVRAKPAVRAEVAGEANSGIAVGPGTAAEPGAGGPGSGDPGARQLDSTQLHPERHRQRQPAAAGPGTRAEPTSPFSWPLAPAPTVSRAFQPPSKPYGPGHRGVDLIGAPGQPVLAAGAGTVVYAGPLADRGVVSVDHADGLRTTYEPVTAMVHPGQVLHRGEPVGALAAGHLGCSASACLHWGLRRDGQYLDPLMLVRPARVRLLPWPVDPEPEAVG
jgi:murein DD-endopeptidase MepM/ murein hydrolase activator NlpD